MNCTQSQQMLDDYLDSSLSTIQLDTLHRHLSDCDACSNIFSQAEDVLSHLRMMPVPPIREGYEQRMLKFLDKKQSQKSKQRNWFMAGFGSALAATLAIWLNLSPVSMLTPNIEKISTVNLTVRQTQKINLVFNLANDLHDATLTLDLPEKIEISGYPGKRQLKWKTSLKKGTNRLVLPLIATKKQNGYLTASLTKEGKTKLFRIHLSSQLPASSILILDKVTSNT